MKLRPFLLLKANADLLAEFVADHRIVGAERRRLREYFALRRDGLRAAHYAQLLRWLSPRMRARLKRAAHGEMLGGRRRRG